MNLGRADRQRRLDLLAAEYALGTLPWRARRRLQRAATGDPAVAHAIEAWEQRLCGFAVAVPALTPAPRVWNRISTRLGLAAAGAAPGGWWTRMPFWRAFALASFAGLLALGVGNLVTRQEAPGAIVVVLAGPDAKPALVATASRRERVLRVKAVAPITIAGDRSLELWLLPAQGDPRSMGVVPAAGTATLPLATDSADFLAGAAGLAITLEPAGGSPSGKPTGPILYTGKIEQI